MRGIGEPFKAQAYTGAAGFSIPLPIPAARGFVPPLALEYNSGNGNGAFGLGFVLATDSMTVKTSQGIPTYGLETSFILSSAGELIPALDPDGHGGGTPQVQQWTSPEGVAWTIATYIPRVQSSYDRIEQWQEAATQTVHWRVVTSDNVVHSYGVDADSRIADPDQPLHVFEWLLAESHDAHGNRIRYHYRPEDSIGIPDTIYNVGRDSRAQRYLWQVQFGNYKLDGHVPDAPPVPGGDDTFAFCIQLDYGQIDPANPNAPAGEWTCRPDPFSSYKASFEVRTYRRCNGIYLYHQFAGENGGAPFVTQATLLDYATTRLSALSMVARVWQRGYRLQTEGNLWSDETPALTLRYQAFAPEAQGWKRLDADAPNYLGNNGFTSVDLYGEGIDGLLWSDASYTGYLRPLGLGRFGPLETLPQFPNNKDLGAGHLTFTSIEGNGVLDLVVNDGVQSGYFKARDDGGWHAFQNFPHLPADFSNPDMQLVDIDGSGRPAMLLYDHAFLKTYASEGALGYADATFTRKPPRFPATDDGGQAMVLSYADVFGDGLPHRVRIQDGRLEAWPCLGHGHFGKVVSFGNAPVFEGGLDATRLHLIDTDGSGAIDIVYMLADKMRIWVNQNGNSFAAPIDVPLPSPYGTLSEVTPGDFTGFGTASLLLTQVAPQVTHTYYDFSGGHKPYLLQETHNGMGGTTHTQYTTSVLEYLRDRLEGRPWPTLLPFPVHIAHKITVHDETTGSRFTQRFRYHDGYFDPIEREFMGFGFVESWDTEDYEEFEASASLPEKAAELLAKNLWVPPVHTKSWFLTGAYAHMPELLAAYQRAAFQGDPDAWDIPAFVLDPSFDGAEADTLQQAYLALSGHNMRTETYAIDGSGVAQNPYVVAAASVALRLLQPQWGQRYCSLQVTDSQSLAYNYERNPADPQITQSLVLVADAYGQPLLSASVAYPRRPAVDGTYIYPEQQALHCTVAQADYINTVNVDPIAPRDFWQMIGVNWQGKSFAIGGISAPADAPFTPAGLLDLVMEALENPMVAGRSGSGLPWSRLLTWDRSFYWNADQSAALPGGTLTAQALAHSSQSAMLSADGVTAIYGTKVSDTLLQCAGGYVLADGYWWNPGLVQHYHREPSKFYLPTRTDNPIALQNCADGTCTAQGLDVSSTVHYDRYMLHVIETAAHLSPTEALRSIAQIDYQRLQPWRMVDANDNVSEVLYDPLGKVIASTVYGQLGGITVGDLPLNQYVLQPDATFENVIADPRKYLQGATQYFYYDLFAWQRAEHRQPVNAIALQRMQHVYDDQGVELPVGETLVQVAITFNDGAGSTLQAKAQVGPGPVTLQQGQGTLLDPQGEIVQDRWLVTGRVVHNNKGQPTEVYEPFFSAQAAFESQQAIIDQQLVPPPSITQYDPLGRAIKATTPKGFFAKTTFTPWQSQAYDANDTVLDSAYYQWFQATYPAPSPGWQQLEADALAAAAKCYNTPGTTVLDNLGRAVRSIADNLGAIAQDAIPPKIADPQTTWQSLVDDGYLTVDAHDPFIAWVSPSFQPYVEGFSAIFQAQYSAALEDWLAQSCLTSMAVYDSWGNTLATADPRLYAESLRSGNPAFNFEYAYDMAGATLYTRSVDAGERWTLSNLYGHAIQTWDSRGFNVQTTYDRLQRPLQALVVGGDGATPLNNVVQLAVYGESVAAASSYNLRGQIFQQYDSSGLTTVPMYGLGGQPLQTEQQIRPDYATEANWSTAAQAIVQAEPPYVQQAQYNALGLVVQKTLPDCSVLHNDYFVGGRLMRIWQEIADADGVLGAPETVQETLGYDAHGNQTLVRYGNGVQTRLVYDAMTQHLVSVRTTRPGPDTGVEVLREIQYTYDPVANKTAQQNLTAALQYHHNQSIAPINAYTYDPLYHLVAATGMTLPGLNAAQQGSQVIQAQIGHHYAPISDLQHLENYTRTFAYDAGGNLVLERHSADSGSWTQANVIASGSNRLQTQAFGNASDSKVLGPDLPYDANGNLLRLYAGGKAVVAWNYRDNIARVTQIARSAQGPDGEPITLDDAEYYVYDASGMRTRKVTERMQQGGATVVVTDKLYLGSYEVKQTYRRPTVLHAKAAAGTITLLSEKRSIHASDGDTIIAISAVWVQAPAKEKGPQAGDMQTRYCLHDPLGSVALELTATAQVISYEEYYPYGGTAFTLARSQLEADAKEYRFCGKECDAPTGLYYYGARYYTTWQCRWMSPDPAGTVDGPNLYAYVRGNPINYNDPTGMAPGGKVGKRGKTKAKAKAIPRYQPKFYKAKYVRKTMTIGGLEQLTSSRPKNQVTNKEGDHSTALITFRHMIKLRVHNKPTRQALRSLKSLNKSIQEFPGYDSGKVAFKNRHKEITQTIDSMLVDTDDDVNTERITQAADLLFELRGGLDFSSTGKVKSSRGHAEATMAGGLEALQKKLMKFDDDDDQTHLDEREKIMNTDNNTDAIDNVHKLFDFTAPLAPYGQSNSKKQPARAPRVKLWEDTLLQHVLSLAATYYFIFGDRGHFSKTDMVTNLRNNIPAGMENKTVTRAFWNDVFAGINSRI